MYKFFYYLSAVFLLIGLSQPLNAQSPVLDSIVLSEVCASEPYVIALRRHFHQYPELGGHEKETVKRLKTELKQLGGFEIHDVSGSTGFYAILDTHREGPTIGLRTDIDGLPILESVTNGGGQPKPWVSKNVGITQGCGHDGHMSILVGAARILSKQCKQLRGRFVFIFEEGEESNTGIRPMLKALSDIHFDVIYGNHLTSAVPTGHIFVQEGPIMAGMATIALHVNGRGGHASRPDQTINSIPAAAEIVSALGLAWQHQRDITQMVTLGIAQLQGGTAYNIIPNSTFVGGTLRFFSEAEGHKAVDIVRRVSEAVAGAHLCTVSYDSVMTVNLPPVVNDTLYTRRAFNVINRLYPGCVVAGKQYVWYASETFALYARLAPIVFTHIGCRNETTGITAAHHTDQFDLDEDCLKYGVGAMTRFAIHTSLLQ